MSLSARRPGEAGPVDLGAGPGELGPAAVLGEGRGLCRGAARSAPPQARRQGPAARAGDAGDARLAPPGRVEAGRGGPEGRTRGAAAAETHTHP